MFTYICDVIKFTLNKGTAMTNSANTTVYVKLDKKGRERFYTYNRFAFRTYPLSSLKAMAMICDGAKVEHLDNAWFQPAK